MARQGDRFGFSWHDGAAVPKRPGSAINYCHSGDVVGLNEGGLISSSLDNREMPFQALVDACK